MKKGAVCETANSDKGIRVKTYKKVAKLFYWIKDIFTRNKCHDFCLQNEKDRNSSWKLVKHNGYAIYI